MDNQTQVDPLLYFIKFHCSDANFKIKKLEKNVYYKKKCFCYKFDRGT